MNSRSVFQKIPLYDLIDVLHRIYEEGADYIDISGKHSPTEDSLIILVKDEYYLQEEDGEEKELKDEDIDKLI